MFHDEELCFCCSDLGMVVVDSSGVIVKPALLGRQLSEAKIVLAK